MEAAALETVQAQLQALRAELGFAPATSLSRPAVAQPRVVLSTQPQGSDPDLHNADTFGGEAQNEEADDAINDETFGGEVTFETRHDAHNDEVCEMPYSTPMRSTHKLSAVLLQTFGGEATFETRDDAINEEVRAKVTPASVAFLIVLPVTSSAVISLQTFGGEATYETRHDAHNEETFGEAAQNESIDDAANDETFGEAADDEVTFAAQPPAAGQWGSHAISALAKAFEDEREREGAQHPTDHCGRATSSGAAAGVVGYAETDAIVDAHALLSAWVQQGASLLSMLSMHPTNAGSTRAAARVALAAVNTLVEEVSALKVSEAPFE